MFIMESINLKSILSFFNEKDGSKPTEASNSQNENDANISSANVESQRYRKRLNESTLMISGGAENEKENFSDNMMKNTWNFAVVKHRVMHNVYRPYVW